MTTASYAGPAVVATNPPSPPPYLPGNSAYPLKGCFQRTGGIPIVSGFGYVDSVYMTVDACFSFCSQYPFYFLSVENGKYGIHSFLLSLFIMLTDNEVHVPAALFPR